MCAFRALYNSYVLFIMPIKSIRHDKWHICKCCSCYLVHMHFERSYKIFLLNTLYKVLFVPSAPCMCHPEEYKQTLLSLSKKPKMAKWRYAVQAKKLDALSSIHLWTLLLMISSRSCRLHIWLQMWHFICGNFLHLI